MKFYIRTDKNYFNDQIILQQIRLMINIDKLDDNVRAYTCDTLH